MQFRCIATSAIAIATFLIAAPVAFVHAGPGPTTRGALEELNRQTTELYQKAQSGIYRVQLPQPKWINAFAMASVKRWDKQLDPELRKQLERDSVNVPDQPSTTPIEDQTTTVPGQGTYRVIRPRAVAERDPVLGGSLRSGPTTAPGFSPTQIGLLLDDQGRILVPLYVERETIGTEPVKVAGPDGTVVPARFIGSDRQTNLTLLQVERPNGTPVHLASARPATGSLVMCIAVTDGSGHLGIWSDTADESGIVFNTEGQVAGIAHAGQFLTGSSCGLIVRQLIQFGAVKRATLGVLITEVRGSRMAMRIDEVIKDSAADRAGLKVGDLVLAVGSEPVRDLPSFAAAIAACDGPTKLQLLRGDTTLTATVELQQQK